ncbi:MAG: hypothetical protein KA354_24380 [Phycisphaerae bacterium]|nr:hypothetical protein [Phycisphaerae bacterium]
MIVGDPSTFAIESQITRAYRNPGLLALGFFVIHVGGKCYGLRQSDATLLACSFDEVERRLAMRGAHTAPFATLNAGQIAEAFREAIYAETPAESYFGIALPCFRDYFGREASDLMWAPDGDTAFDDGSYVLQCDVKDHARLIAFRSGSSTAVASATLVDVWIAESVFYEVLQRWCDLFEIEWTNLPKAE